MTIALYYFSGTGNSLRVAQELQQRLPDSDLIPIIRHLGQDTIKTHAETVGLIFPNFCMTIPIPLHDFLEKADLTSAQYSFAICTRGGTPSEAFDYINEVLQKQGRRLDAAWNITMPWNHPLAEENLPALATEERIALLDAAIRDKVATLSQHILTQEAYIEEDTDATDRYHHPEVTYKDVAEQR